MLALLICSAEVSQTQLSRRVEGVVVTQGQTATLKQKRKCRSTRMDSTLNQPRESHGRKTGASWCGEARSSRKELGPSGQLERMEYPYLPQLGRHLERAAR
jgi:hypothetical protein